MGKALALSAICLSSMMARPAAAEEQSRRVVVIDPGHGGSNRGAASTDPDRFEKHITLEYARVLKKELQARGLVAILTRDRDEYLTLRERARRANEVGADLFLSLHMNASPTHGQRGFETFVLSRAGLDVDSRALRAETGSPRPGVSSEISALLDDVERGAVQPVAARLAAKIQGAIARVRKSSKNRGVRQDSMHVLLGATMPAVLIELGFIDHSLEGREMLSTEVRDELCVALADAIAAE